MKIRARNCRCCGHLWASAVTIGEFAVRCPNCDDNSVSNGPVQETDELLGANDPIPDQIVLTVTKQEAPLLLDFLNAAHSAFCERVEGELSSFLYRVEDAKDVLDKTGKGSQ